MTEAESREISSELKEIRKDLNYIKKHMADADTILTDDDLEALSAAEEDLKQGKTKRL